MAPTKGSRTKRVVRKSDRTGAPASNARSRSKVSKKSKVTPPVQQRTKSTTRPVKKKRRFYTDKELGIPKLNMITPTGVDLPKGKKKGKIFVDDQESMMTILAIVNASKEGQIESKMLKSRHMEEIREARRKETEARQEQKRSKLEETKESIRRKRKRKYLPSDALSTEPSVKPNMASKVNKKRVSFAN